MNSTNKKKLINNIVILLISIIIIIGIIQLQLPLKNNVYFFNSKVFFQKEKNVDSTLSLAYISSKNSKLIKEINSDSKITSILLNNNINVKEFNVNKADFGKDNYKVNNIDFYYLNMVISTPSQIKTKKININNITLTTSLGNKYNFNIGDIELNVIDSNNISNDMLLMANRGLNLNSGLKSYSADYINNSNNDFILDQIDVGDFYKFKPTLLINNNFELNINQSKEPLNYIIKPGEELNIKITFNSNIFDYDSYYFSPIFELHSNNSNFKLFTPHTVSGLSINFDELRNIYKSKQLNSY